MYQLSGACKRPITPKWLPVTTGRILAITAAVSVSTDTVIDKTLRFSGARITVAPEVKLTIYKPIEAGEYQLFDFDVTKPVPIIG